ncbi:transposase (plasmid) [Neorhizobium galegae]|nr:transposase [Neorhizobium galegae]
MLHVLRVGCSWRDMHERYGKWNSVYVRFRRWAEQGGCGMRSWKRSCMLFYLRLSAMFPLPRDCEGSNGKNGRALFF